MSLQWQYWALASDMWKIHTYSLTLWAFMCVSKADVFEDSPLAVAHVPGLDQQDTIGFYILAEDVVGLAHTLSSRLVWKK